MCPDDAGSALGAPVPDRAGADRPVADRARRVWHGRSEDPLPRQGPRPDGDGGRQCCGEDPKGSGMTDKATTVVVPFTIRKRGGRKLILTPDGIPVSQPSRARPDSALLKALARGFRWKKMLQEGAYQTLEEIADAENINPSYVSRLLRMTLLSPEIVEAVLAGRQPPGLTMARAMQPFSPRWADQSTSWTE